MRGVAVLLLMSLVTPSTSIAAQRDAPFEIGEVLRITAPACGIEEQTARYLRIYRDTLTVQADSVLTLHVADVTRLDLSRGISDKSTLYGIGAGAFAGVLIGIAVASDQGSDMSSGTPSNNTGTQILKLIHHPGSEKTISNEFEVGYQRLGFGEQATPLKSIGGFVTHRGIKLGVSLEEVVAVFGEGYQSRLDGVEILYFHDVLSDENTAFLDHYNMPIYYARYRFENNHLIWFRFGFDYP